MRKVKKFLADDALFFAAALFGIGLALYVQYMLRGQISGDMENELLSWYLTIKNNGLSVLRSDFSNYPPLYFYIQYVVSVLFHNLRDVVAVKLAAIFSCYFLAFYVMKIVSIKYTDRWIRLLAFLVTLFFPTVLLNGAFWGQADGLYGAFVIAGVYYLLKKKHFLACLLIGLAFSIKFQAVFIFPLLIFLLIKKQLSVKYLFVIPGVYLITIIPAWLMGRPLLDLLIIYFGQVGKYSSLTMNAPSLYALLPQTDKQWVLSRVGTGFGLACGLFLIILGMIRTKKGPISETGMVQFGLLSTLIIPFCLPLMHERYFYLAEAFVILYSFYFPRYFYVGIALAFVSSITYTKYLINQNSPITLPFLAIVMTVIIALLLYQYLFTPTDDLVQEST
jgi:Gpi18-like mannosyltransferase